MKHFFNGDCGCDKCGKTCRECECGGCQPLRYNCGMNDIQADPFDPTKWKVTNHGVMQTVSVPKIAETDTTLSTNFSTASLIYNAEAHIDQVTGSQLGDLINLADLRDVDFDKMLDGNCYELIYRKFHDCGKGCKSAADRWENWNVNSEGAKQKAIPYVRGANILGCPTYLDQPANTNKFWFGMWVPSLDGFSYYSPASGDLMTNADGDPLVFGPADATGKPVVGPVKISCLINNLIQSLGAQVDSTFRAIQQTPKFTAYVNTKTGDWEMRWNDWYGSDLSIHWGEGWFGGKMDYDFQFDHSTGNFTYTIHSISIKTLNWRYDRTTHVQAGLYGLLTIKLVGPDGTATTVVNQYQNNMNDDFTLQVNRTIPFERTITVGPGGSVGPLDFVYFWNDIRNPSGGAAYDDEGYLQMTWRNKLQGWTPC